MKDGVVEEDREYSWEKKIEKCHRIQFRVNAEIRERLSVICYTMEINGNDNVDLQLLARACFYAGLELLAGMRPQMAAPEIKKWLRKATYNIGRPPILLKR